MGFVKVLDNLSEWGWYSDNNTLAVYMRLLLGAAWKDGDYQNVHLQRGQVVTTIPQIAQQGNLTVQQTRTILERLKSTGKITVEKTSKFSIITLIEYDCSTPVNSQNNRQITGEQQSSNSQATGEQQSFYINNRNTEDKKVSKSEVASASPTAASITRDSLIESFGEENVNEYEQRYDRWKASKGGVVKGDRYTTIRRMMEQDGVQKPVSNSLFGNLTYSNSSFSNSSINFDAVRKRILQQYTRSG